MIEQLLAQFFEHLRYERNVSEHTLRNYASDLGQFYDYLAPADAEGKRLVELNPAKLVSTPRLEKKLPNHLSIEDAVRFIETPDTETDLGRRDRAILELLYGTGVRVSELTKLDLGDVDFAETAEQRGQKLAALERLDHAVEHITLRRWTTGGMLTPADLAEHEKMKSAKTIPPPTRGLVGGRCAAACRPGGIGR